MNPALAKVERSIRLAVEDKVSERSVVSSDKALYGFQKVTVDSIIQSKLHIEMIRCDSEAN